MLSSLLCIPSTTPDALVLGLPVSQTPVGPEGWGYLCPAGLSSCLSLAGVRPEQLVCIETRLVGYSDLPPHGT